MNAWLKDFHYGARMIVKRPGTSAIAIIALALGIGLTAVMFSIVQGAVLRGLPFPGGDRIMMLERSSLADPTNRRRVPIDDFVDWSSSQQSFGGLAAMTSNSLVVGDQTGFPERLRSARITPNTLSLLRVQPMIGRDLTPADAAPGAPAVVLIGHRLWTSRFGGEASALGQQLRLNGTPTTVVGVMPPKFGFPTTEELWLPWSFELSETRGEAGDATVFGRLNEGVSEQQASAEMTGIARQLATAYPENEGWGVALGPYVERELGEEVVSTLLTMLGAVFGVMLIACVNVTNLQLARASERTKEVAIRTALGAGRWRIVRQLLAEGLLLSAVGALLGLGIAYFGAAAFMRAIVDTEPPFWIDVRLDPSVLMFVTGITVAAALVSSVVPGWRVARADANAVLKDETRGATGLRMGAFSRWLIVVEVTASCVLLIVSGLMIRSIVETSRFDYPFATQDVFYAQVSLGGGAMEPADRALQLEQLEARLARIPGVNQVALTDQTPGQGGGSTFSIEGVMDQEDAERPVAGYVRASSQYFEVLRVTPMEGRAFTDGDRLGALPVAIVDDVFARQYLSQGSPIGRRVRFGDETRPWLTVVGIVPSLTPSSGTAPPSAAVFVPMAQTPTSGTTVLARTSGDPIALTSSMRAAVIDVNDQSPVSRPNSLLGELWRQGWPNRIFGGLFLTFGLAALVLAAAGLYGVMSFTVRRRTEEIGVRMALGASRRSVLGMIMWQGFWRVALGIALGIVPGYFVGSLMGGLLQNATAADPVVHGVTAVTLMTAGLLACLAPALRAASVNPLTALRRD